ncbi:MAG TPA: NADH-quinone oxidoreductase subunit NuoH [Euryarchaeota archaeon]|nr:NADH-quinone oxidoreductase subunit NuoH [Euryarchaeota archaeon]
MDLWSVSYDLTNLLVDIVNFFIYGLGWLIPGSIGEAFDSLGDWLASPGVMRIFTILMEIILLIVVALLNVVTLIWIERKLLARFWDFRGPFYVGPLGYFQNFADGLKFFLKQIITPIKADKFSYFIAPVIFIGSSILILGTIPIGPEFGITDEGTPVPGSVILAFAIFAVAPFSILVAGWAENNKFTLIGGMRSAAQMMSYEIPLLLSVASVIVLAGSFSFVDVVEAQADMWYAVPLFIGFLVFLVCIVAEVERIPFDLPEAEAELVEGWTTEYSGMRFGFFMMTEYVRGYAGCAIAAALFLGGWNGPAIIPDEFWFLIKAYMVFVIFVWIRASLPRIRTDQILDLGWKRLLPLAMLNLVIAVVLKTLGVF